MSRSPESARSASTLARATARELRRFEAETAGSRALSERAHLSLSSGVASAFQIASPWPVYLSGGEGARVVDVDGVERIDFHNGFGATLHGHANTAIAAAVRDRYAAGSQFGAPTEDAIAVAEELSRRWGLPQWRFSNSGTEAAGDAIRIARGATGREIVVKAAGAYHGVGVAEGKETEAVPFNDPAALERKLAQLAREGRPAACLILEPALMLGCVLPEPGYLAAAREMTAAAGALLIFDEAKTGMSIAAGGAVERFGVVPDLVTVAKALGGGLPAAAVGGAGAMAALATGEVPQAGTFNGNPLAMAAARVSLEEVLTAAAYARLERTEARLVAGLDAVVSRHAIAARALGIGARGALVFAAEPVREEAEFKAARRPELERLLWLFGTNRGLYLTPARPQNWTLSVAHGDAEADAYVAVLDELLGEFGDG